MLRKNLLRRIIIRPFTTPIHHTPIPELNHFKSSIKSLLDTKTINHNHIDTIIQENQHILIPSDISYLLYCTALNRFQLQSKHYKIANEVITTTEKPINIPELSRMLFGLKDHDGKCDNVCEFLSSIANILEDQREVHQISYWHEKAIAMSLFGLKNMSSSLSPMPKLLRELSIRLRLNDGSFSSHSVINAVRCITNMNSSLPEVKELVSLLAYKIHGSSEVFTDYQLYNALRSLYRIDSSHVETRGLIHAILGKVPEGDITLTPHQVGTIMWSLQHLNLQYEENRELLQVVNRIVRCCEGRFTPLQLGRALYGMREMNKLQCKEACGVFVSVSKLANPKGVYRIQDIKRCMFGLNNTTVRTPGYRNIVSVIRKALINYRENISASDMYSIFTGMYYVPEAGTHGIYTAVAEKVKGSTDPFNASVAATAVICMRHMNSRVPAVKTLISAVSEKIEASEFTIDDDKWMMLYGMQNMSGKNETVLQLIRALVPKFRPSKRPILPRDVGCGFFGLREMYSRNTEVKALLRSLNDDLLLQRNLQLDGRAVGSALHGLRNMSAEHEEVRNIVNTLAEIVSRSKNLDMQALHVSMALYGFQGMTSDSFEVRALLRAITPHIKLCGDKFTPIHVSNMLHGLKGMSSGVEEVNSLLQVLGSKIDTCDEVMEGHLVTSATFGLRGMKSEHGAVRDVLSSLLRQLVRLPIGTSDSGLAPDSVCSCMFGIQNLNPDYPVVRDYMRCLLERATSNSDISMTHSQFGRGMYGLKSCSDKYTETCDIIEYFYKNMPHPASEFTQQHISSALYGMQRMTGDHPIVRKMAASLADTITSQKLTFSASHSTNAIVGLRSLNTDYDECRQLIAAVTEAIRNSVYTAQPSDITFIENSFGASFNKLQTSGRYPELKDLFHEITLKLAA